MLFPRNLRSAQKNEGRISQVVDDFYSSAAKTKTVAHKTMRPKTFPDYLLIQLKKFDIGDNWVPYKLDVEVSQRCGFDQV